MSTEELIWNTSVHFQTNAIRKEDKSIFHRLCSIKHDADFVTEIRSVFPSYPLIANERCGSWYIDREETSCDGSVYFKSTDGHFGKWSFSVKRNNFHLLDILHRSKGCLIVDATRRGKSMPDSLSKTIPIWCCVVNRAVDTFRQREGLSQPLEWDTQLYTSPKVTPPQEKAAIEELVDSFVDTLLRSGLVTKNVCDKLQKPLRPFWYTQETLFVEAPVFEEAPFFPVICVSASSVQVQRIKGASYIQGAADDEDSWAMGLTWEVFWKHWRDILNGGPEACEATIKRLVTSEPQPPADPVSPPFQFIGSTNIAIGSRTAGRPPFCWEHFEVVINCTQLEYPSLTGELPNYLFLDIPEGKKGQVKLLGSIPKALSFVEEKLRRGDRILVHCAQGKDRSVAIALSILIAFFDDAGCVLETQVPVVTKELVQKRLAFISQFRHLASISRTSLKRVHMHFMSHA